MTNEKLLVKIKALCSRYFITALNGMAVGLFASLIIGTVFSQLVKIPLLDFLQPIATVLSAGQLVYGAAIGAGVALALKHKPIVIVSSLVCGTVALNQGGGPLGAYIASLVACEVGNLVVGRTKVDIIVTPFIAILVGGIVAILIGAPIGTFMTFLGSIISKATTASPFIMGVVIAVVTGMCLTAPISSAAICITLGLSGSAAGAAAVGCSVQMIGFAVQSFKKNGLGGSISVGIGTSMLQFTNIVRKPIIWLPTIITSAILGPVSITILNMTNTASGAGMGTCGLVGQFGAFEAMRESGMSYLAIFTQVSIMHFVAPIILVFVIDLVLRKINLYSSDDLLLYRDSLEEILIKDDSKTEEVIEESINNELEEQTS